MTDRIYLAVPYTHPDPKVRRARFEAVTRAAGELMKRGHVVFSPVTMGHPISEVCDIPQDFNYWGEMCLSYFDGWATRLVVLMLPGWELSRGVEAEIAAARENGVPVEFLNPDEMRF